MIHDAGRLHRLATGGVSLTGVRGERDAVERGDAGQLRLRDLLAGGLKGATAASRRLLNMLIASPSMWSTWLALVNPIAAN
ncbi:hypothetical protein [Burkholderia plantarii]|uniref:hypothetical protein n=1 Tax=Burkholderia plantarii TaxID=41899 RepID=UPI0018DC873D|nr:hypothetical protein [Burkholderia plantarii]MBI0327654.1 hypothetical protein [Burkholderia plantarii]